jgi:hypothetical protein
MVKKMMRASGMKEAIPRWIRMRMRMRKGSSSRRTTIMTRMRKRRGSSWRRRKRS